MTSYIHTLYFLLIYLPTKQSKNKIRNFKIDDVLKNIILFSFAVGVGWAEYALFSRFWELLDRIPGGLPLVLPRLFSLLGSFLFAFLFYSSILTALSAIYRSQDVGFLLAFPVPKSLLLLFKWFETAVRSGATLVLLTLPPMVSLGLSLQPSDWFYPAFVIGVLSVAAIGVSLGMIAAMILMLFFPEKRLHQSLAIIGLCLAVLLITGLRFLHMESMWGSDPLSNPLVKFLTEDQGSWLSYAPGLFFTKTVVPFIWGSTGNAFWIFLSFLAGTSSILLTLLVGYLIFFRGWCRSQEQPDPTVQEKWEAESILELLAIFPRPFHSLMQKDWGVLKRDASVWSQLFMMVPLAGIYLLNLSFLPINMPDFQKIFAVINVGLIGLIIAAVSARFLFPSASREGKSIWIPVKAPLSSMTLVVQKIFFSSPPVILLSVLLLLFSGWIMELPVELMQWSLFYGIFLSIMLCILAVSLGFCFPIYDYRHLLEVSLGKGAFLFMITAVTEIGSLIYLSMKLAFSAPNTPLPLIHLHLILWLAGWLVVTLFSLWWGKRKLSELEF